MGEAEWLTSDDPQAMLAALMHACHTGRPVASPRQLRLFAVACCRLANRRLRFDELEQNGNRHGLTDYQWAEHWAVNGQREVGANVRAALFREIVGNPWRPANIAVLVDAETHSWSELPWLTPTAVTLAQSAYDSGDWAILGPLADVLESDGCQEEAILRHLRGQERAPDDRWFVCRGCGKVYRYTNKYSDCGNVACEGEEFDVAEWIPLRGPHVKGCWVLDLLLGKE